MQVRVLGCSGAIAKDCRTTAFLIDDDVLVDAGTGVGDLTLEEMAKVDDVVLTHSHIDHIAALPLMIDAVASRRRQPLRVHALRATNEALRAHVFNNVIWPDFASIPSREKPFVSFHDFAIGDMLALGSRMPKVVEVLSAVHTVPACGFAVRAAAGGPHWVFSGDTERNPAFWERINTLDVGVLVIETAFSNREQTLAERSLHLSPTTLADELACIGADRSYPIYITHTKPAETGEIMNQIESFVSGGTARQTRCHDIRWLQAAEILNL